MRLAEQIYCALMRSNWASPCALATCARARFQSDGATREHTTGRMPVERRAGREGLWLCVSRWWQPLSQQEELASTKRAGARNPNCPSAMTTRSNGLSFTPLAWKLHFLVVPVLSARPRPCSRASHSIQRATSRLLECDWRRHKGRYKAREEEARENVGREWRRVAATQSSSARSHLVRRVEARMKSSCAQSQAIQPMQTGQQS